MRTRDVCKSVASGEIQEDLLFATPAQGRGDITGGASRSDPRAQRGDQIIVIPGLTRNRAVSQFIKYRSPTSLTAISHSVVDLFGGPSFFPRTVLDPERATLT